MKIRNGFVSNSSSSSFVVVVPKNIDSVEEMHKFMFKKNEEFEIKYYDHSMKSMEVASQFFNDHNRFLEENSALTDEELIELMVEEFSRRYYVAKDMNVWNDNDNSITLKRGYHFYYEDEPYFGTDKELANKLIVFQKKIDKQSRDAITREREFIKNNGFENVNDNYEKWENFRDNSVEYRQLKQNEYRKQDKLYKKQRELERQLAKKDVEAFLKDVQLDVFNISIVSYNDNDSRNGALMEHGRIFDAVKHVSVSHH